MDFNDTPQEAAFRAEVRAWLAGNAAEYARPPRAPWSEAEIVARGRAWLRRKAEAGYATITWPKEIGGRGGTPMEAVILGQEEGGYTLPEGPFSKIGVNMACPTIRRHGTAEQYERFAGPTLRGEILWCQLFSEPGAGSDLAGVRTKAVRDGDAWIVSGQKVWSSWAHHADWAILLARTDPGAPKHKGLTFFVLDMKTPGIEVRPIRQINGKSDFNETFLTDVVIPDSCRIGAVGEGWACAMTVLMNERAGSGGAAESFARKLVRQAGDTQRDGGSALDSAAVRQKLARWYAEEQGLKYFGYRMLTSLSKGEPPPPSAAMVKLVSATLLQETRAFAMDLDEVGGLFEDEGRPERDEVFLDYLWSSALRIAGGADEILRNQLAERMLGMPGEMRADKDVPFDQLP